MYNKRLVCSLVAAFAAATAVWALPALPSSRAYYLKWFSTSGSISTWYFNDQSWGVTAPSGTGFVAMMNGEDLGTTSPATTLPKKISAISPSHHTQFSQTASPAAGAGYDATYDILIDKASGPADRKSAIELKIWVGYKAPNVPLANVYPSDVPLPIELDVPLAGKSWDVYFYTWAAGTYTISYVDRANSGSYSGSLTDFFNHGVSNGWYTKDHYLNAVMAGWEFGQGNYTATSWAAAGF